MGLFLFFAGRGLAARPVPRLPTCCPLNGGAHVAKVLPLVGVVACRQQRQQHRWSSLPGVVPSVRLGSDHQADHAGDALLAVAIL
jgi:hypothetical protein